jgi:hypothetical protein
MIKLNKMEQNEYNAFIVAVVPSLLPGTYHFRDFFTNRVTSARIGRKFYEDVVKAKDNRDSDLLMCFTYHTHNVYLKDREITDFE